MITINVACSGKYDILIENGLLDSAGAIISERFKGTRVCVITDDNVAPIYLSRVTGAIKTAGIDCEGYVFGHGEANKTLFTIEGICTFLAEKQFTRSDMLVALGGGIVGDVTGFAASVYQRGIRFIQIPTTVLAAVDSSVGGKTGVNLGGLKNQVGAFRQPSLVLCDPETFKTLPAREFSAGMAEVIKYAAICCPKLKDMILDDADISEIIAQCVSIKRDIVQRDELDKGERQLLNLGHTFGHAVEKATRNALNHGEAVSVGTVMAFRAAEKMGLCPKGEIETVISLARACGLPIACGCDKATLLAAMQSDKKRAGAKITLVLPREFGKTELYPTDMASLEQILGYAVERSNG